MSRKPQKIHVEGLEQTVKAEDLAVQKYHPEGTSGVHAKENYKLDNSHFDTKEENSAF